MKLHLNMQFVHIDCAVHPEGIGCLADVLHSAFGHAQKSHLLNTLNLLCLHWPTVQSMCNTHSSLSAPAYVHAWGYSTEVGKFHISASASVYPSPLLYIMVMSTAKQKTVVRHQMFNLSATTQWAVSGHVHSFWLSPGSFMFSRRAKESKGCKLRTRAYKGLWGLQGPRELVLLHKYCDLLICLPEKAKYVGTEWNTFCHSLQKWYKTRAVIWLATLPP